MGWSFRKSKSFGPFRLTASKSGLSVSAGVKGARVSANSRGQVRRTISIPGTGFYNTERIDAPARKSKQDRKLAEMRKLSDTVARSLYADQTPEQKKAWVDCYLEDRVEFLAEIRRQIVASGVLEDGIAADMVIDAVDEDMRVLVQR